MVRESYCAESTELEERESWDRKTRTMIRRTIKRLVMNGRIRLMSVGVSARTADDTTLGEMRA